jgi:heterodisulfide reductase subunit A
MIDCYQHPNVETLTYSEVIGCTGSMGSFKVQVRKKPRYVDIEKCTGCGECFEKCPKKITNDFNMGLDRRKAIYMPFLQSVPKKATIDADYCLKLLKDKCGNCEKVCKAGAIDYEQKEEIVELDVGAIIVSVGLDYYDAGKLAEYGYGRIKGVITAMELERFICASGPTSGHIHGVDGEAPKTVAFIQCAGSRDFSHIPYCSAVCCMHSTKEAILANEHYPDLESYIFYIDLRAVGKGFQGYTKRAENEYKVTYIRSKVGRIVENKHNEKLQVQYEETKERKVKTLDVDLVVLAQALCPSKSVYSLSGILGFDVDEHGFVVSPEDARSPMDTTVSGIFACGFVKAPQDIPESVAQASGAAARAAEVLLSGGETTG